MLDLPVQGNPVQVNAVVVKQKSPESGDFGAVFGGMVHRADRLRTPANRGVSRGDRGGVRGWCRVGLRTTSCWRIKLIYWFVGLFTCVNPAMQVSAFLNRTKSCFDVQVAAMRVISRVAEFSSSVAFG